MKARRQKLFLFFIVLFTFLNAKALPLGEKEWTFLLFLNGHNNLSSYGDMNLKDMEKVGSTDQVNMVVEWGRSNDSYTHRLLVEKSKDPTTVTSPILMSTQNYDMGDVKNLVNFVKWGVDNFPAKHYFIAVWNHGSGWHIEKIKSGEIAVNDISFDDNTNNFITTEQLGAAMTEIKQYIGRSVDIYGSDACLMQMIEVATEMKSAVNYFVGSEEVEPGEGWPYPTFMQKWVAAPQSTPAQISILLSKEYLKAYSGGIYPKRNVTLSALDVSKLDAVIESSSRLATHIKSMDAGSIAKIGVAAKKVQSYSFSDYKDYGDFIKTINGLPINKDVALLSKAAADLKALVLTSDNSKIYEKSTGLAIWIPNSVSSYGARYKGLAYDKLSNWSEMLEKIVQ